MIVALAVIALQAQWPVGVEREVDQGIYMKVHAEAHGWRVWRIETRDGVRCQAIKPPQGRPQPVPVGVGSALYGSTPFLMADRNPAGFGYSWWGRYYGEVRVKYRLAGERFWTEPGIAGFNADRIGERPVDVVVSSWRYPEIRVGFSEEEATVDLTGLSWAQAQLTECTTAE